MKFSDDAYDVSQNRVNSLIFGILCAVSAAAATVYSTGAAYIFIAILIGNLIAFKVDGIHHIVTLLIFIFICCICGIPQLSLVILLFCVFSALFDEVGHETINQLTDNKYLSYFFDYRCAMKVVVFILAVCGVFSWYTFLFFLIFEITYEIAGVIYEDLFN